MTVKPGLIAYVVTQQEPWASHGPVYLAACTLRHKKSPLEAGFVLTLRVFINACYDSCQWPLQLHLQRALSNESLPVVKQVPRQYVYS
jgi:hypothetical protein